MARPNGDAYVADAFVAKYSPLGKLLWTLQLSDSSTGRVATDAKGNVLISGSTQGRAFVAKYSPGGSLVWTRQLADSGAGGVATDAKGNVIISGSKWGSLGGALIGQIDAFAAKFSPSGKLLWARTYAAAGGEFDITYGEGVAADADGNVLLTGTTLWTCFRCFEPRNAFIAKYTASGHLLWTRELTAADWGSGPVATSVAADHSHNVVIVGYTLASLGGPMISGQDAFIAKYSAWGKLLWTRNFTLEALKVLRLRRV